MWFIFTLTSSNVLVHSFFRLTKRAARHTLISNKYLNIESFVFTCVISTALFNSLANQQNNFIHIQQPIYYWIYLLFISIFINH